MKSATQNWLTLVEKEIKIAESCLTINEPLGVIFHLHAAAEKTLKAVYEETRGTPPKIHNLMKLALECCGTTLEQKDHRLLDILDKAFIDSRYPKDLKQFESEYNINSCKELIEETKGIIKCLKNLLKKN